MPAPSSSSFCLCAVSRSQKFGVLHRVFVPGIRKRTCPNKYIPDVSVLNAKGYLGLVVSDAAPSCVREEITDLPHVAISTCLCNFRAALLYDDNRVLSYSRTSHT